MTSHDVYLKARSLGLFLSTQGSELIVAPKGKCPANFRGILIQHKAELVAWLNGPTPTASPKELPGREILDRWPKGDARPRPMDPNTAAWARTAKLVMASELDELGPYTTKALLIGVRGLPHPTAKAVTIKLEEHLKNLVPTKRQPKTGRRTLETRKTS